MAVPPSSLRMTLSVALPKALAAGVKLRVPLAAIAGATLNSDGLVLPLSAKVRLWPLSLAPADTAVAQSAE